MQLDPEKFGIACRVIVLDRYWGCCKFPENGNDDSTTMNISVLSDDYVPSVNVKEFRVVERVIKFGLDQH